MHRIYQKKTLNHPTSQRLPFSLHQNIVYRPLKTSTVVVPLICMAFAIFHCLFLIGGDSRQNEPFSVCVCVCVINSKLLLFL